MFVFARVMNSGRFGIILLVVVAALIVAALVIRRCVSSEWGFKDVVKNPKFWDWATKAGEEIEVAKREALGWSDEKVASVTKHFIFEVSSTREAWTEWRVLHALDARTHRTVLDVLRDTRERARLVKPTGTDVLPGSSV